MEYREPKTGEEIKAMPPGEFLDWLKKPCGPGDDHAPAARVEKPEAPAPSCVWSEDEDGVWYACDSPAGGRNAFTFDEGGPDENNFTFCPYCGKKLAAVYDTSFA